MKSSHLEMDGELKFVRMVSPKSHSDSFSVVFFLLSLFISIHVDGLSDSDFHLFLYSTILRRRLKTEKGSTVHTARTEIW